ncbi:hypothetical protein [Fulvivirga ligni]|nr:hypothetical protein [Fulvivirga ligni]UII20835.1 hypothetical protein LVD16_23625 [Fulvivirga ligni]
MFLHIDVPASVEGIRDIKEFNLLIEIIQEHGIGKTSGIKQKVGGY